MSKLHEPCTIGPITLRNPTIRSAAFENMCVDNAPSEALFNYHSSVAKGGVGMTTVAYAAVSQSGLSFKGQLWMRPEIVPALRALTDGIHAHSAKASIQLGHCGNMTHRSTCGQMPLGASSGFNLYSPTFVRALSLEEISQLVVDFATAVDFAIDAGFDCVEIHAGHGYLISQFLSPYTNKRKDAYGGSLSQRMRFMREVVGACMERAAGRVAVIVKCNMYDGFKAGLNREECLEVARELEGMGVDGLVLSAGFVSKAPMVVMRGAMPLVTLAHYMDMKSFWWLKLGLKLLGKQMIAPKEFTEAFFLEDALYFRQNLKLPLIYVGGIVSRKKLEEVLEAGFVAVQMGRALIHDTDFVEKMLKGDENTRCNCKHSNYCVARMYSLEMQCHHCVQSLPPKVQKEIARLEEHSS